jgi:hypothetical protein
MIRLPFCVLLVALLALIVGTSGCGGTADNAVIPSFYRGNFSGTWASIPGQDGGPIQFVIQSDGSLGGTIGRKPNISGSLAGMVDRSGRFTAIADFGPNGNFVIGGNLVLINSQIQGSFAYQFLGVEYSATMNLSESQSGGSGGGGSSG